MRITLSLKALLLVISSSIAAQRSSQHSSHSIGQALLLLLLSLELKSSSAVLLPNRSGSSGIGCCNRWLTDGRLISALTALSAHFKSANSLSSAGSSFPSVFNFPACSLIRRSVSAKGPVNPYNFTKEKKTEARISDVSTVRYVDYLTNYSRNVILFLYSECLVG